MYLFFAKNPQRLCCNRTNSFLHEWPHLHRLRLYRYSITTVHDDSYIIFEELHGDDTHYYQNTTDPPQAYLVTSDIESLYTNIPPKEATACITILIIRKVLKLIHVGNSF